MLGKVTSETLTDSVYVTPENGGTITVGENTIYGTSTVDFEPGAVSQAQWFYMSVTTGGPIHVDFQPSYEHFGAPVTLDLSYEGADTTGIDPSSIHLYWDSGSSWDLVVPSDAVAGELRLTATLTHFSQYAPGSED
jgi:hypothetical protein